LKLATETTLQAMRDHGWENVRGTGNTAIDMKAPPKGILAMSTCTSVDAMRASPLNQPLTFIQIIYNLTM